MALGPNSIRTQLYCVNFIFVLTGFILATHGMQNFFFYRYYGDLINESYTYISYLQIVLGFAICFVAIIGWYGAIAESPVVTLMFSTSLLLIFFFVLSLGIGGYFLNMTTRNLLSASLRLPNGTDNDTILFRWERLQNDFSCCGIEEAVDWSQCRDVLPESCCYDVRWKVNECLPGNSYKIGCFAPLEVEIQDNCITICLICFTIATFQLLGVALTCYLSGEFRKGYQRF